MKRQVIYQVIILLIPSIAMAADDLIMDGYFRMIWALAIVVGIMFVIFAIVKKGFSPFAQSKDKKIKVIEIQAIMPKKSICLIEVNDKQYLLAISQDNIEKLDEFPIDRVEDFNTTLENISSKNK